MQPITILDEPLTPEFENKIGRGFRDHAMEHIGFDGGVGPFCFVALEGENLAGVIRGKFFYKSLQIVWLFVFEKYRHQKVGTLLMERVIRAAEESGCSMITVDTLDFQAMDFYKKFGFDLEFSRQGYAYNRTLHYLRKNL
jgi:GNAT superfamily N-acetyltransferase